MRSGEVDCGVAVSVGGVVRRSGGVRGWCGVPSGVRRVRGGGEEG